MVQAPEQMRKTKLVSGTTYSPPYLETLVTLSLSLLRKVSLDTRREDLLPGKWLACFQSVITGIIPGNHSDNIDVHFQDRRFLMFPSKLIHTHGVRAGVMSSFGFGQVGGTALVVHPRHLFGALEPTYYEAYKRRNHVRALSSYKRPRRLSRLKSTRPMFKLVIWKERFS